MEETQKEGRTSARSKNCVNVAFVIIEQVGNQPHIKDIYVKEKDIVGKAVIVNILQL